MRKYIIGALVGAVLSYSVSAYGSEISNIGKKIQGEYVVSVDGTPLSKKAVAVDGTTYVPLRVAADEFGYDTKFVNNTVQLTKKGDLNVPVEDATKNERQKLSKQRNEIYSQIAQLIMQDDGKENPELKAKYDELARQYIELTQQIESLQPQVTGQ